MLKRDKISNNQLLKDRARVDKLAAYFQKQMGKEIGRKYRKSLKEIKSQVSALGWDQACEVPIYLTISDTMVLVCHCSKRKFCQYPKIFLNLEVLAHPDILTINTKKSRVDSRQKIGTQFTAEIYEQLLDFSEEFSEKLLEEIHKREQKYLDTCKRETEQTRKLVDHMADVLLKNN